jgi:hypothetical protein
VSHSRLCLSLSLSLPLSLGLLAHSFVLGYGSWAQDFALVPSGRLVSWLVGLTVEDIAGFIVHGLLHPSLCLSLSLGLPVPVLLQTLTPRPISSISSKNRHGLLGGCLTLSLHNALSPSQTLSVFHRTEPLPPTHCANMCLESLIVTSMCLALG